jgi:hypothetical protein
MTDLPGYRQPDATMIKMVTEAKYQEERIMRWIDQSPIQLDQRWRAIAITHLEEATMALVRAILRPGRVTLPEDKRETDGTGTAEAGADGPAQDAA